MGHRYRTTPTMEIIAPVKHQPVTRGCVEPCGRPCVSMQDDAQRIVNANLDALLPSGCRQFPDDDAVPAEPYARAGLSKGLFQALVGWGSITTADQGTDQQDAQPRPATQA